MYNPKLCVFKICCFHINSFAYLVMCTLIVPIVVSANTETCFCDSSTNSKLMYNSSVILKKYENGNIASIQEIKNKKFNGLYESWWRNGNRRAQGWFINGRENGDYFAWYNSGQQSSVVNFELDKILECSLWNKAGKIVYQGKDTKRCNDIYVAYYNTYSLESDEPD
ncbi:TPA: hypothetical protein N3A45_003971 [Salmonella enterica subsp. salamae serovar [1],40:z35:e,n,x,z15]|nr:hypothetical protein [Salmonella enterica]HCM2000793.1 hypothetical protein [Salmonella enterica subsp. salamae serovar [1],40:z35:e,n,x,z15]